MTLFEIKRSLRAAAGWFASVACLSLVYLALYPSMKASGLLTLASNTLKSVPPFVLSMLGIGSVPDFNLYSVYFLFCDMYLQIKLCLIACISGCECLISEESEGTLEFLYAQPVSRAAIVRAKLLSRAAALCLLNLAIAALETLIVTAMDGAPGLTPRMILMNTLPQLEYMLMGAAVSALLRDGAQATLSAMCLFFSTCAAGILSRITGRMQLLEYLSPYYTTIGNNYVSVGPTLTPDKLCALLILSAATVAVALIAYSRRDFRVK